MSCPNCGYCPHCGRSSGYNQLPKGPYCPTQDKWAPSDKERTADMQKLQRWLQQGGTAK